MLGMRFGVRYGGRIGGEGEGGRGVLLDEGFVEGRGVMAKVLGGEGEGEGVIEVTREEVLGELERKKGELEGALEEMEGIKEALDGRGGGGVGGMVEKGKVLLGLRTVLLEGEWENLEGAVGEVGSLGGGEREGEEEEEGEAGKRRGWGWGGAEVWLAKDEIRGRKRAMEVLEGLRGGVEGVKERSGEWSHPGGGVLGYWLGEGEGMGLREELKEVKEGRELLERVREVEGELGEGVRLGVGYGGRGEGGVGLFLDDVWGGVEEVRVRKIGGGEGEGEGEGEKEGDEEKENEDGNQQQQSFITLARNHILTILKEKNEKLRQGLEKATTLALKTRLTEVGKGIYNLREALLEGNWESVEERVREVKLKGVGGGEGWGEVGGEEVRLGEDERRGREAVKGCLEGLKKAVEGLVGGGGEEGEECDEWVHPVEGVLERGLGEGERLGVKGEVEEMKEGKEWLERVRGVGKGVKEGMGEGVMWGRRVEVGLILEGEVEKAVVKGGREGEEGGEEWEVTREEVVKGLEKGVNILGEALAKAREVGITTRWIRIGKELWGLRKALLERQWKQVEEQLGICLGGGVGKGGVGGGGEVRLAEDELAGRSTVDGVLEELKKAVERVRGGGEEGEEVGWVHPSEGVLERGLGKAERLGVGGGAEEVKEGREMLERMREVGRVVREGMRFGVEWGGRVGEGGEEGGVGIILDDDLGVCGKARVVRLRRGEEEGEGGEEGEEGEGQQREIIEVERSGILEELERQGERLTEGLEKAQEIGLITKLIIQGRAIMDLRRALEKKNWEEVERKIEEAEGKGVRGGEVWLAKDELKGRERGREVLEGLERAVAGVSGEESKERGHWAEGELERWLEEGERVGVKGELEGVVKGREMLEELRGVGREVEGGMRWMEYGGRVVVQVVLDRDMSGVEVVKFRKGRGEGGGEVVEMGREELVAGLREVTERLEEGVERARRIGLKTRLVEEGERLLRLRKGLLEGLWGEVENWLGEGENEGVGGGGEVVLARDEVAGRGRGMEVLEGLRKGVEGVKSGVEEEWVHPSEGELERWLGEGERVGLKGELEEVAKGKEVLKGIREVRRELQKGLEMVKEFGGRWEEGGEGAGWGERVVELAEGYEELYELFDGATQQLKKSVEMATGGVGGGEGYVTKEVREVEHIMSEVTILWYLLEDLQGGGYLEGGKPTCPPVEKIVLDPITSRYTGRNLYQCFWISVLYFY